MYRLTPIQDIDSDTATESKTWREYYNIVFYNSDEEYDFTFEYLNKISSFDDTDELMKYIDKQKYVVFVVLPVQNRCLKILHGLFHDICSKTIDTSIVGWQTWVIATTEEDVFPENNDDSVVTSFDVKEMFKPLYSEEVNISKDSENIPSMQSFKEISSIQQFLELKGGNKEQKKTITFCKEHRNGFFFDGRLYSRYTLKNDLTVEEFALVVAKHCRSYGNDTLWQKHYHLLTFLWVLKTGYGFNMKTRFDLSDEGDQHVYQHASVALKSLNIG